jgi:hypothetical protein
MDVVTAMSLRQDVTTLIEQLTDEQLSLLLPLIQSMKDKQALSNFYEESTSADPSVYVSLRQEPMSQQKRAELVQEIAEVRQEYEQGYVKFGSVSDFMAEIDRE